LLGVRFGSCCSTIQEQFLTLVAQPADPAEKMILHHREGNFRAPRCDAMVLMDISGLDLIAFVAGWAKRGRGLNQKVRFLISAPKTHFAGYFEAGIGYNGATRDATRVQTQICKNGFRPDPKKKTQTRRDTDKRSVKMVQNLKMPGC
jgi:hypothetical protein